MAKFLLSLAVSIFIVHGAAVDLPVAADDDHDMGGAHVVVDDGEDEWWNDPAIIAALNAMDPPPVAHIDPPIPAAPPVEEAAGGGGGAIVPAVPPIAPAPHAGGIVGAFVPPVAAIDLWEVAVRTARADAHAGAFPFAAIGRSFLCNVQKSWLRHWTFRLRNHPGFNMAQRNYPLRYVIPSFGWNEVDRFGPVDEDCQMCGKKSIHVVVLVHNHAAPVGFRDLRVGVDCVVFMKYTPAIVWQTAFDHEFSLP